MLDYFIQLLGDNETVLGILTESLWGEFVLFAVIAGIAFVACTMYIYLVDALAGLIKGLFKIK